MGIGNGIVIALVAGAAALALRHMRKHRDAGCDGNCASCGCACNQRVKSKEQA